jgi:hypothetical protein
MKIGIDISQIVFTNTGVSEYLTSLVNTLLEIDDTNEYVLFFSSFRGSVQETKLKMPKNSSKVTIRSYRLPLSLLEVLWNRIHFAPIEWFIGEVDVFITSDWIEPPVKRAKKATILYDLIVYKYPQETADSIVSVQKRKLQWVKKESAMVFCISDATKQDAKEILGIPEQKLSVLYPGMTL